MLHHKYFWIVVLVDWSVFHPREVSLWQCCALWNITALQIPTKDTSTYFHDVLTHQQEGLKLVAIELRQHLEELKEETFSL